MPAPNPEASPATRAAATADPQARDGSPLLNYRRAVPDEPVPSPRNRLDEVRVGTEGDADVPDGEVDALVVSDVGVWPQCRADLLARDELAGMFDQQAEQERGL